MNETEFYFEFPRVGEWSEREDLRVNIPSDAIRDWILIENGSQLYDTNDASESVFQMIRDHYCVLDAALIAEYYRKQEHEDVDQRTALFERLKFEQQDLNKQLDIKLMAYIATLFLLNWYEHNQYENRIGYDQVVSFVKKYNKHIYFMFRNGEIDPYTDTDAVRWKLRENLDRINGWRRNRDGFISLQTYGKVATSKKRYAGWHECFQIMQETWNSKKKCIAVTKKDKIVYYAISGVDEKDRAMSDLSEKIEHVLIRRYPKVVRQRIDNPAVNEFVFACMDGLAIGGMIGTNMCSLPIPEDVRFYYTTYCDIMRKIGISKKADRLIAYNRMFSCSERKLFGIYAKTVGEVIVASECCDICKKVAEKATEFSNIHVKYLVDGNSQCLPQCYEWIERAKLKVALEIKGDRLEMK